MATEKQVRTNIDPELHEEMTRAARRLGLTKKDFFSQAIKAKLDEFDADFRYKTLKAENTTLSVEKEQFRSERDDARQQRDHFKAKHEEAVESIGKLQADLEANQSRGLVARIFNRPTSA